MNYRMLGYLGVIIVALLIFLAIIVPPVSAMVPRIEQGDVVFLNDTVDISGVTGWADTLAYCGGYSCSGYDEPETLKIPAKSRTSGTASQYNYWIDPEVFGSRTGEWHQYSTDITESHGNTLAFIVAASYRNTTLTYPNGSVFNQTGFEVSNVTTMNQTFVRPLLPEVHISDYLVARGDNFTVVNNETKKIWIFGRVFPVFDVDTYGGNTTFNNTLTHQMEPGSYSVILQYPGNNTEYDVRFHEGMVQWRQGWDGIKQTDIAGIQPRLITNKVIDALNLTDDRYEVKRLEVQDPLVTIERFDEIPMYGNYSRYQEFKLEEGLVTLFNVRGYTNLQEGTNITVILDENLHTPHDMRFYTTYANAQRTSIGNMSYYEVYVPVVWDKIAIGMHTLTARTEIGAEMTYNFPVSILPEDSFKPNVTVKYAMDRNPWIPTPTPEIRTTIKIEKVIEVVTKEIPVTPSVEVVKEQQANVIGGYVVTGVIICFVLVILGLLGWYLSTVIKRAKVK